MKQGYYRIGEVSQITGISKDTLHFYERAGVLVPDARDPENHYRYYSRGNLWQLDIITTCRKLRIPLETVKQILALRDNEKIVHVLMDYREEALRLSKYYQQIADDIAWYRDEHETIARRRGCHTVEKKWLPEETVAVGSLKRDNRSYHANLQEAVKDELSNTPSIRKKYGYILDPDAIRDGRVVKQREYLKIENSHY